MLMDEGKLPNSSYLQACPGIEYVRAGEIVWLSVSLNIK